MQKKLIALAVAGMFAAPAFAATSNVDIYGVLKMSGDFVNDEQTTGGESTFKVGDNSSRFGLKGSEDLGGGLAAIWQFENSLQLDNGAGTLAGRNSFVGLKSNSMGTVLLGRHDTPYKMSSGFADVFSDSMADYNTIIGSTKAGSNTFDVRGANVVAYLSPSFSGFSVAAAYAEGNEAGNAGTDANVLSLSASYANGPLKAALAWEEQEDFVVGNNPTAWKLAVGYTFGNTTLNGVYESIDGDGIDSIERSAWYVSAQHNMGNIALKAAYGQAGESDANTDDDGARFWAVGMDYNMSKRTTLFAQYSKVNNDEAGTFDLGGTASTSTTAAVSDADQGAFSLGIRHTF